MALSSLSFMSPSRVRDNLSLVRDFSGLSGKEPAANVLSKLQSFPIGISQGHRHFRITTQTLDILKRTISGLMGGEFPTSFRIINRADFEDMKLAGDAAEACIRKSYPEDWCSYDELISSVVYAYRDEYSGGSVSNHIGWIWLSPEPSWTVPDYVENILHEYTHNVLFLEEMVHTLFSFPADVMALTENQVVSAIRKVPRFFDQSYHAAAVAIVLAEHAIASQGWDTARLLVEGLMPSLDLLKDRRSLMTDNGWELLREMIGRGLVNRAGSTGGIGS